MIHMSHLSLEDRVLIIELYYQNSLSPITTVRKFQTSKNLHCKPFEAQTVSRLVAKFKQTGSVCDAPKSGRPSLDDDTTKTVEKAITASQQDSQFGSCSSRGVALQSGISQTSVLKIMKKRLKLYPYKIQSHHELLERDYGQRFHFSDWFLDKDDEFTKNVLWSDECIFYLKGYVNTQNCRIWGTSKPDVFIKAPLHSPKVTVWCGMTANFILKPHFFLENVCSDNYCDMIINHAIPALKAKRKFNSTVWQQDGATAHTAIVTKNLLRREFTEQRIIGLHFPQSWPPRSPDINPCDFFLWGYLKDRIFTKTLNNLDELKATITTEIEFISSETLNNVFNNLFDRLITLYSVNGRHVE